mmetsp:Transcript_14409/g.31316  ORF Transcript_14409/g.31316 Transcript_14409/m.31316 type:complete len:341 (+) Transcript_14409:41-1063(+)
MTTAIPPFPLWSLAALGLASLCSLHCVAFVPPPQAATTSSTVVRGPFLHRDVPSSTTTTGQSSPIFSTKEGSTTSKNLEVVKLALKRPRGASVGVEYAPLPSADDGADSLIGDLSILSMQLRKSKCAAIWTPYAASVGAIAAEQEGSRGDFPGPVPVIYSGSMEEGGGRCAGAAAVVLEYSRDCADVEWLGEVGIVWKVNTVDELRHFVDAEKGAGGVVLLSRDMLPQTVEEEGDVAAELRETLSALPRSVVTVAPLTAMLPENGEISLGKHYASLGVSSLLLEGACVGDEEDARYGQYAIEEIGKKSSSSFSITGLTGSTNGHFGVSSHGGETKWRRKE